MKDPRETELLAGLAKWLNSLPRDSPEAAERRRRFAVAIAFRAAARTFAWVASILPADVGARSTRNNTSLSVYRALVQSFVSAFDLTDEIGKLLAKTSEDDSNFGSMHAVVATLPGTADPIFAIQHATHTLSFAAERGKVVGSADEALATDVATVKQNENIWQTPLWPSDDPLVAAWQKAKARYAAAPGDWSPVIEWYEHVLDPKGRALDLDMMREIALIPVEVWDAGPEKALPVIGEIWRRGRLGPPPTELLDLARVTLYRFTLDQVALLMRAIQPPKDWKRLEDPDALGRFLEDVSDLLEDIDIVCLSLEREGSAMQGGGTARTFLERVRFELQRASDIGVLRISKLIEWVRQLDGQVRRGETRLEFGPVADPFAAVVDSLGVLVREHFAHVLVRLSDLRDLQIEDGETPRAILDLLRLALVSAAEGNGAERRPLAPEDVAAFDDMLESIDRLIRDLDRAEDPREKSALLRETEFQLAKVMVSLRMLAHDAKRAGGTGGDLTDDVLKVEKRTVGLMALGRKLLEAFAG